jgi:L-2,4-diaminobutyrate decarboxylase
MLESCRCATALSRSVSRFWANTRARRPRRLRDRREEQPGFERDDTHRPSKLALNGAISTVEKLTMDLSSMFVGRGGLEREEALDLLSQVLEVGLTFKERDRFYDPLTGLTPQEVMAEPLPLKGQPIDSLLRELEKDYLPGMNNFGSRRFVGFPDAGNSIAGISGAILADLLNPNMINSTFCARIATEMEIALIRWLREIIGYNPLPLPDSAADIGGMVLSGGTMANYTALLIAREHAFPATLQTGINFDPSKVKVIVPEWINHYTIRASSSWLGLGSNNVLRCPITNFKYNQALLRDLILRCQDRDEKVIMLAAYAGDSRTMTIDDLKGVHDLVREIDPEIWLHCDGCHGTSLCFSENLRQRVSGIELWDSITLDPHKVLSVPYPLSMLLLRDPLNARSILTESDLIMRQKQSLGQTTPVLGSKAFHSFKLWFLLKTLGVRAIGKIIEDRCLQAQNFADIVNSSASFILLNQVSINSVVFMFIPDGIRPPISLSTAESISALNHRIYQRVLSEGEFYVHSFITADNLQKLGQGTDFEVHVLRYMGGNPLTTPDILKNLLDYIASIGIECWNQLRPESAA